MRSIGSFNLKLRSLNIPIKIYSAVRETNRCNWCGLDDVELREFIDIAGDKSHNLVDLCKRCAEQGGFKWEYQGE